jgi:hypothetical protein
MRRRRILRRALRRPAPALRPLAIRARRMLIRAHQLQESGQQAAAAELFDQLAEGARQRGLPQYPQLLLQSARAHVEVGKVDHGISHMMTAFQYLLETDQVERIRKLAPGVRRFLQSHQLDSAWLELEKILVQAGISLDSPPSGAAQAGGLPVKCPYCGGTLNPEEVESVASGDVICLYCRSVVKRVG